MIAWIASFVRDRTTIVKTNKYSTNLVHISTGIPQGSSLSLILYLFYNKDLLEIWSSSSHQITAGDFIDDTVLLSTCPSIAENCQKLKKTHQLCVDWAKKHTPKFDLSKYQLVFITKTKCGYKQRLDLRR